MPIDLLLLSERIVEGLAAIAPIVGQLRDQAMPSMQAQQDGRISGSPDVARPPMQVGPLDEADELWAVVWELVDELCEKAAPCFHALATVATVRARQARAVHAGVEVVRGYASSEKDRIYWETFVITQWLIARASTLAFGAAYRDSVTELLERVDRLGAQVGTFTGYRFQSYREEPCPNCHETEVVAAWGDTGRVGWRCEYCEWEERIARP